MSHWTKVKTTLTNLDLIKKGLERMGLSFSEGDHTIKQYGTSEKAQLKLDSAVGISQQADGTFSMVGDFYHSHNSKLRCYYGNTKKFTSDLGTAYAVEEAKENLETQGFFCTDNSDAEIGEDGMIRMTFESY